jgi:hypothetical protein
MELLHCIPYICSIKVIIKKLKKEQSSGSNSLYIYLSPSSQRIAFFREVSIVIAWIWNVPQRLMCGRLGVQLASQCCQVVEMLQEVDHWGCAFEGHISALSLSLSLSLSISVSLSVSVSFFPGHHEVSTFVFP